MKDVYKILAEHLDGLPGGYPETENGVEIRILKRLFSEDEAKTALGLTMIPEPVSDIAKTPPPAVRNSAEANGRRRRVRIGGQFADGEKSENQGRGVP